MTWPAAKVASASTSVARFGKRKVARAITGAPTIMPTANAVISSPICDGRTPKSSAICGSSPAIRNSVVHIKNAPSASTGTIGGNGLLGVRTTVAMSPECRASSIDSNTAFGSLIENLLWIHGG